MSEQEKSEGKKSKVVTRIKYKRLDVTLNAINKNTGEEDTESKSIPDVVSAGISYPLPESIQSMPSEVFKAKIDKYFKLAGPRTTTKFKGDGQIILEIPVPYSLDDMCLMLGMTKNELFVYASMSVKRTRLIEGAVMKITSSLSSGALTQSYPAKFVYDVLKSLDEFWNEGRRGALSTMKPNEDLGGGGKPKKYNFTMITVNTKEELAKVNKQLGRDEVVDTEASEVD